MKKDILLAIFFVILEVVACIAIFFRLTYLMEAINFPRTDSLFIGVIQLTLVHTIAALIVLILMVAINQRMIKETFNYKLVIPSLLLSGLILALVIAYIQNQRLLRDLDNSNLYMAILVFSVPVILMNIGLRMRKLFK